jgi:hypothetical protein
MTTSPLSPAKPGVSRASATACALACAAGTVLPSEVTPTTVTALRAEGAAVSNIEVQDGEVLRVGPGTHATLSFSAGTLILEQGLHQVTGGISLSGSAVLQLENATVQLPAGATFELLDSAAVRGTCASGHPEWNGVAFLQRPGSAEWSMGGAAVLEPSGRLYAPGAARMRLTDDVAEIALPASAGRARLIR